MSLALDGLSYISRAIEETRIRHIEVRDESTDTIVKIEPGEYADRLEFYFLTPGDPDASIEELLNIPAPF